jgi:hypothetical protein
MCPNAIMEMWTVIQAFVHTTSLLFPHLTFMQ